MTPSDDPLWDPAAAASDPQVRHLQQLLAPYALRARGLAGWTAQAAPQQPVGMARPWRRRAGAFALAACLLLVMAGGGLVYRLRWDDGRPWPVAAAGAAAGAPTLLQPGAELRSDGHAALDIQVARIGRIQLQPDSQLALLETRSGQHRVRLRRGHLRARIWAPPGDFGVRTEFAEVIDLGCDFELWSQPGGSGRLYVHSGWVAYRMGQRDVLLPAGFGIEFAAGQPSTPLRPDASAVFKTALQALERVLETNPGGSGAAVEDAAVTLAASAEDADAFSLLSLLSQQPQLARSALYPRLAQALLVSADASHRDAWAAGEQAAIDRWWERLPTQPKHWWRNFSDVLR